MPESGYPPICILSTIISSIRLSPTRYETQIVLAGGGQVYGTGKYDGLNVKTYVDNPDNNIWIGNFADGYAFRFVNITSVTSQFDPNDTLNCVIEDVDSVNEKIDITGGGNEGAPSVGSASYIFELIDGLPTLSQVQNAPNVTWTDSLVGRFTAYRVPSYGGGGGGTTGATGGTGATGATGPTRKGYYASFSYVIPFLADNTTLVLNKPELINLDLSVGNTIIVQNLDNIDTRFEGIIQSYNKLTGVITLNKITNIFGSSYGTSAYVWSVNLSGERGAKFFNDTSTPSGGIGRVGDYYVNMLTGELYLKQ